MLGIRALSHRSWVCMCDVCRVGWGSEEPALPLHHFSWWVIELLLSTPVWLFSHMFPSSLTLFLSSCFWHFCLRVRVKARKVMFMVSRVRNWFQKREVEEVMGKIVSEVMGKGTLHVPWPHEHSDKPIMYNLKLTSAYLLFWFHVHTILNNTGTHHRIS